MGTLHNQSRELHRFRLRLAVAFSVILVACGVLATRFAYLQVVQYEHFQTQAEANRISILPVVPNRGLIKDRNGLVLAHNYSAYTLEITPSKAGKLDATIEQLATVVEITAKDRRRFKKLLEESRNFESLPIRTRLTEEEVARFAVSRYRFPGVDIKARLFREYPFGEVASHAIGYIGRINAGDVERLEDAGKTANYRGTDHVGKIGLEQSYEDELHGVTGFERVETDAGGRAVRSLSRIEPTSGNNLILSLDIRLQEAVERAFGERRGALVAVEPSTGEILAFVSRPGFDPNLFVDGIDQANWDALNNSPDHPLNNRALQSAYPPGSTFKPYMALAALTLGRRTPQQAISDPGYFSLPGMSHRFRDDKPGGHGYVDMYKSIVVSCDTYYYQLANDLGIDAISKFMGQFGFGQLSGVDILGEKPGVLPSQEWKMKRYKQKWYSGETISVGIGQGYNSQTPLQMAHATATLANDGVMVRPRFVHAIQDSSSGRIRALAPEKVKTIPLKAEHLQFIKNSMVGVNKEGTGARAFAKAEYVSAGKTGTAQVIAMKQNEKYDEKKVFERHRDHALFIAFAPVDTPKIALAVLVENGGFGAVAAAPIARQVLDYYLTGKKTNRPAAEIEGGGESD
ncbi:MAG: penicillin-binding protein 2 [Burkholderiales bacterium]|nr:penicillin-binding protein 2 [Burkholderiales bacterium]